MEAVPIMAQFLMNSSTASLSSPEPDFALNFVEGEEMLLEPGAVVCFGVTMMDDHLNEPLEDIKLIISQGSNTTAVFSIEAILLIFDNDFSEYKPMYITLTVNLIWHLMNI